MASRPLGHANAAALVVSLLLLSPQSLRAQQGWSSAVELSPPASATWFPEAAVDAGGTVTVVWAQDEGAGFAAVAARFRPAVGTWDAPVAISRSGFFGVEPAVAAGPAGGAMVLWVGDGAVYAARLAAGGEQWDPAMTVAAVTDADGPTIAVDPQGNAFAAWDRDGPPRHIEVARYDALLASWSSPLGVAAGGAPQVGTDDAGNAILVWTSGTAVQTARYSAVTETWSAPTTISTPSTVVWPPRLVVSATGDATIMWPSLDLAYAGRLQSARFTAASGTWSAPVAHAETNATIPPSGDLTLNAAGEVLAAWGAADLIRLARWSPQANSWDLLFTTAAPHLGGVTLGADALGNTIVAAGSASGTKAWRYAGGGAAPTLSGPVDLCLTCDLRAVVIDAAGNSTVIWTTGLVAPQAIHGVRWNATPNAPAISAVTSSPGALDVTFSPPQTSEPAFAPVNYDYSLDDGATWIRRSPASTAQPLAITGLKIDTPYSLRLHAVNGAGAGAPSARVVVVADAAPHPPADFAVRAIVGNTVTFSWTPPQRSQYELTGYVLEGGIQPGEVLASIPVAATAAALTLTAPSGIFLVRLHTLSTGLFGQPLRSLASNEVRIVVEVPEAPSPPASLLSLVNGADLALSWTPTFGGGAPTGYALHVSGALSGAVSLPASEVFTFSGVPAGTYTLAVSAWNAAGSSALSNSVTLTFPRECSGAPGPPPQLLASRSGRTITVMWDPPETGAAATGYELRVVGSLFGAIPTTSRTLSGTVGAGNYGMSVAATNACGVSLPSPSVIVVVP